MVETRDPACEGLDDRRQTQDSTWRSGSILEAGSHFDRCSVWLIHFRSGIVVSVSDFCGENDIAQHPFQESS